MIYGLARSFGPTHRIAELAREKLQGIRSQDYPTVVKHFPDHGNARDTHDMHTVCDTRSMQEIDHFSHAVYRPLVGMIDIIMTNHIQYPSSPDAGTEAGLSAYWLQRARTYLGDTGLIISDCLGMGAMQAKGLDLARAVSIASLPDANAPSAMTDIVLVCNQPSYTALLQALSHQPNPACTQRINALKRWARSKSPAMQRSLCATMCK